MKVLRLPRGRSGVLAALVAAAVMSTGMLLKAQEAPVLAPPTVLGANVTFTWTPVTGATSYTLQAGVVPGVYLVSVNAGNTTTFSVAAPAVGAYYARIVAHTPSGLVPSHAQPVVVTSMYVPPAAPTGLTHYYNGRSVIFTWNPGVGGGVPTGAILSAGSAPGLSDIVSIPVGPTTQFVVSNVPANTYYVRVAAHNPGGQSAPSNEVQVVMTAGGECSPPPTRQFTTTAFGRYVQFDWQPVPGAAGYILNFTGTVGGQPVGAQAVVGGNSSHYYVTNAPLGEFTGSMTTVFSCGSQAAGTPVSFTLDGAPPPGPRAPNPAPGQRLPLINRIGVINQLAAERPDLLHQSCVEHGGNNRFMFEAVRRLRAIDNRWGLNWKRGWFGDLSQDIVNYNHGSEPDEGTRNVYIIDIIGGHCGSSPSPFWADQTQATRDNGTIGIWTLLPYINAGYPIVSDPQFLPEPKQ